MRIKLVANSDLEQRHLLPARKAGIARLRFKALALAASWLAVGLTAAGQANAGCVDDALRQLTPSKSSSTNHAVPAVFRSSSSPASFLRIANRSDDADQSDDASIVGLWEFTFAGFLQDFGTQSFHAGGTETVFSAGVNPATGDVCQGVWRKVGASTYTLNHIAMLWTAPGAEYGVLAHFHMLIKLAPGGDSYTGTYKLSLYSETPQDPFGESAGPFASGSGTVSGKRVKPD